MSRIVYSSLSIVALAFLSGCTSIQVLPVAREELKNINEICIVNNPTVKVADFVPVVESRLMQYNIKTRKVGEDSAESCHYTLRYSARRSWDLVTYLSWAKLNLFKRDKEIANAEYSLIGKGGLAFTKYQSIETKMNPVIDQLLGHP
ncbi:Sbal_3080 family lipoprotein [Bisgaard Taxon 45]